MIIQFNNIWALCSKDDPDTYREVRRAIGFEVKGAQYSEKFQSGEWDGTASFAKYHKFPAGLIPIVKDLVGGIEWIDRRPQDESNNVLIQLKDKTLRDYQQEAINEFLTHQRGIIELATRSGKTLIAIAVAQNLDKRTLFLTHTKNLLKQTRNAFKENLNIPIGIIGDGQKEIEQHTVGLVQSIGRRTKAKNVEILNFLKTINFVVFDEIHRSSALYKIISQSMPNAKWRLGLSATVCTEEKEKCLSSQSITGPIIYSVNTQDLIDQKRIADPLVLFLPCPNKAKMPKGKYKHWPTVYKVGNVEFKPFNLLVCISAIIAVKKKKTVLIIVQNIDHGKILCKMLNQKRNSRFVNGSSSTEERSEALDDLKTGKLDVVISTRIFNEGIDIPHLDVVINAAGGKSSIDLYQRYGRPMTLTTRKNRALIIDFINNAHPDIKKHADIRFETISQDSAFKTKLISLKELKEEVDGYN